MIWALTKAFYRTYHFIMKYAIRLLPFPVPRLLTGPGSVGQLPAEIKRRGHKRVLVVTDKVLMGLGLADGFLKGLQQQGVESVIFDEPQPNPTIENVENGRKVYKENRCDGIVAFGGGSPIDCAKIIGARVANPYRSVRGMKGLFKVWLPIPPFYCVPTTAGTGSETTVAAVITDAASHEKFAINDLKLVPKVAVLDPELMVGLPPQITSTTGMDALTHAVEAYIGTMGNRFTDRNAEQAVQLIFAHLEEAYRNGSNLEARDKMALASFYAGSAFTRAYVGYVHALAHNMGGLYGVPHGLANAIILPYVLEFCRRDAQAKLAQLARVGGLTTVGEPDEALSYRFIAKVKEMNVAMQIPACIKELKCGDIPLIARRALKEAHPEYPVPTLMTQAECEALLTRLLVC
jgi:alcohol dehydrogenase class IV